MDQLNNSNNFISRGIMVSFAAYAIYINSELDNLKAELNNLKEKALVLETDSLDFKKEIHSLNAELNNLKEKALVLEKDSLDFKKEIHSLNDKQN